MSILAAADKFKSMSKSPSQQIPGARNSIMPSFRSSIGLQKLSKNNSNNRSSVCNEARKPGSMSSKKEE